MAVPANTKLPVIYVIGGKYPGTLGIGNAKMEFNNEKCSGNDSQEPSIV